MSRSASGSERRDGSRQTVSRSDECYARLRTAIVRGELRPNERLSERALGELLAASRTPVREALQRLQGERLVVSEGRSWVVYEHRPPEIREIYELRAALEAHAARLAATRAAPEQRAALAERFEAAGDGSADLSREQLVATNEAFHDALLEAAGNAMLRAASERSRLYYFNYRVAAAYTREDVLRSRSQHAAILAAVLEGDADRAASLAVAHVDEAVDQIVRLLW